MATKILPVIMCGGAGTRVWPESRETMPKQFIALIGDRSTFQETVARVTGPMFDAPIVITNHDYRFLVKEQLDEIGAAATIVTEPVAARFRPRRRGRGDAGRRARPGDASSRCSPPTTSSTKLDAFLDVCGKAARGGRARLHRHPRRQADRAGDRLWLYPPRRGDSTAALLQRRRVRREAGPRDRRALRRRAAISGIPAISFSAPTRCSRSCRLSSRRWRAPPPPPSPPPGPISTSSRSTPPAFGASPKKSIDYAVMERTKRAAVVPADIGWSDVGNWDAVWKLSDRDADGNSFHGEDGFAIDSKQRPRPLERPADGAWSASRT